MVKVGVVTAMHHHVSGNQVAASVKPGFLVASGQYDGNVAIAVPMPRDVHARGQSLTSEVRQMEIACLGHRLKIVSARQIRQFAISVDPVGLDYDAERGERDW
jgi:hypothetical protein